MIRIEFKAEIDRWHFPFVLLYFFQPSFYLNVVGLLPELCFLNSLMKLKTYRGGFSHDIWRIGRTLRPISLWGGTLRTIFLRNNSHKGHIVSAFDLCALR
jgi:hypothetical protein